MSTGNISAHFKTIRDILQKERPSPRIDAAIDWLTYLLGLLPDMAGGKIAQVGNKIINDGRLNRRFEAVKKDILAVNGQIDSMQHGLERVAAIASVAATQADVRREILAFVEELKAQVAERPTEFDVETSNWSEQQVIDCIIEANRVIVSADQNSRNEITATTVNSDETTFRAANQSANVIRDSTFHGRSGSIGMQGVHTQQGDVSIKDASIGYSGLNSGTRMGGWYMGTDDKGNFVIGTGPETLRGRCPSCHRDITVALSDLVGRSHLQCPLCGQVAQIGPLP